MALPPLVAVSFQRKILNAMGLRPIAGASGSTTPMATSICLLTEKLLDFPEFEMGHPVHGAVPNIQNTWLKLDDADWRGPRRRARDSALQPTGSIESALSLAVSLGHVCLLLMRLGCAM